MKKLLLSLAVVSVLSSPALAAGWLYNDTVEPSTLSQQPVSPCRVGKATCDNYLGFIQLGDCSYEAAMRNGKISHVNHHDTHIKGWFFYTHITTRVYGN
ncbi:MAG: TRL domain-containing protein [Candidatus Gastranaerophilales bacterium]|nr:TRL domain-containing protein [Candidatus Gastranaerophilales bacterium]